MNVKQLERFPKLESVLAPSFRTEIEHIFGEIDEKRALSRLNMYSLFIALTKCESNYTALDILNDGNKLNHQLRSFIGFLRSGIIELSKSSQYNISLCFIRVFSVLAQKKQLALVPISLSERLLAENVCRFDIQSINQKVLKYYSGWTCQSKEGKDFNLHLAPFRDAFGTVLTEKTHQAISNLISTHRNATAANVIRILVALINRLPLHCTTKQQLKLRLKPHNSTDLMEEVMLNFFLEEQIKDNNMKVSVRVWARAIDLFTTCFIDTGIIPPPQLKFIVPEWKEPKKNQHCSSVGGKLSEKERDRWLIKIPLAIKDEQALDIIYKRLSRDLKHIQIHSHTMVESIKRRHLRNLNHIENGKVKPLPTQGKGLKHIPLGANSLANTVATFYHHGVAVHKSYVTFLGFSGQSTKLVKELNLPTVNTLSAFISLLVLEHPKITPAWLADWLLYDRHGNQVGFFQSGKQWIIKSYKNRRGATLAQQEVILNPYSKSLVEALIEHTKFSREMLKKQGQDIYRYMIIACPSVSKKPIRYASLTTSLTDNTIYRQRMAMASFDPSPSQFPFAYTPKVFSKITHIQPTVINLLLPKSEAHELAQIITPRAIRKSCGLRIYLETRSLRAVSEALGHANVDIKLLSVYLPAPLIDFFNARWVRQFQNAIIYEALKDSPFLFDALDFTEEELEEFLGNHGLETLPEYLIKAKNLTGLAYQEESSNAIDELVFTLSTPLFQVLIALQQVVATANKEDIFKPLTEKWCEVAEFIISQFSTFEERTKFYHCDPECEVLYQKALANPIPLERFKENLLCP